jgi:polyferredoxin
MAVSKMSKFRKARVACGWTSALLLLWVIFPSWLPAQYQKKPPDFGETYSFPTPSHPEPALDWMRALDVSLLAVALAVAAWLVYRSRSRKGMVLLSICSVAYFGFFRKGCICSVGAIQNVVLCLVSPQYSISIGVIALFFLPLATALLFGRIFCGGVCPLGAVQDLVLIRPIKVPIRLDRVLRWLQYVYLALAVFFAGWGLQMQLGSWKIKTGQRFLICEWDPFISIFRRSGPFYLVAIAAGFVIAGMFIGRPYCRWLCPYGAILSLLSRVSWKNVSITPDKELNCGKCTDACPYGAIKDMRADPPTCVACSRCYEYCPRQKRLVALRAGPQKPGKIIVFPPKPWEAVLRTWTGILASIIVAISALLLLGTYVHARRVQPAQKAMVEELKEKAKNDAEIQKILQPELDRQHKSAVLRRAIYNGGGDVLLISTALLIFWLTRFRPKYGEGAGAPGKVLRWVEKPPEQKRKPC